MKYSDSLKKWDDSNDSYAFDKEVYSPYSYLHGKGTSKGYKIVFNGCRHILRVNSVSNFILEYELEYIDGFLNLQNSICGLFFGYDLKERIRYELEIKRLSNGKGIFSLFKSDERKQVLLEKNEIELFPIKDKYKIKLSVEDNNIMFIFDEIEMKFKQDNRKGKIGFYRGDSYKEIIISNIRFETSDKLDEKKILETRLFIPKDNGMPIQYYCDVEISKIQELYRVCYKFGGGFLDSKMSSISGDCWAFMFDDFTNPFLRINYSKKLYLFNGTIRINDDKYSNVPLLNETRELYERNNNVINKEISGDFYFNNLDDIKTLSFGYTDFKSSGSEAYSGAREFIFDLKGNVIYKGEIIDNDFIIIVKSPVNEKIKSLMPIDVKDEALYYLENNHFFSIDKDINFEFKVLTNKKDDLVDVKLELIDECMYEKIDDFKMVNLYKDYFIYHNCLTYSFLHSSLKVGVYHALLKVYYCGKLVKEHYSAFEIIDIDTDESPQEASFLPILYINDGGPTEFKNSCPNPLISMPDCNVIHYYSIAHYLPHIADENEIWKYLKLYKKKLLVWCTQRTVNREDYLSNKVKEMPVLKHADYINYGYPGIEDTGNYYRFDYFSIRIYNDKIKKILQDFLDENEEYKKKLGYSDVLQDFSLNKFEALLRYYSTEWIDYANNKVREMFKEQNKMLKSMNNNFKRQSYGPWNVYQAQYSSAYSSKWYGGDPTKWNENIDGFFQFEDYPFCCAYQTSRSAWAMATIKMLDNKIKVYPELYTSFELCPDGFVTCARPPLGYFDCPDYYQVTQMSEYIYNTARMIDGKFSFWDDFGFSIFSLFNKNSFSRHKNILQSWGAIKRNLPSRLEKGVAFVYEMDKKEDRIDLKYEINSEHNCASDFYNISEVNEGYISGIIKENSLGNVYLTNFKSLKQINKNNCNLLVLPSLKGINEECKKEIIRIYKEHVPLFAVGNIGTFENLFGVKENNRKEKVSYVEYKGQKSYITFYDAEFRYQNVDAEILFTADNELPIIFKKNNAYLLNISTCQVGADNYRRIPYVPRINISKLFYDAMVDIFKGIIDLNYECEGKCGISDIITKNNDEIMIVIDYSNAEADLNKDYFQNITISFKEPIKDITYIGFRDDFKFFVCRRNDIIDSITFDLKSKETVMFKIIK